MHWKSYIIVRFDIGLNWINDLEKHKISKRKTDLLESKSFPQEPGRTVSESDFELFVDDMTTRLSSSRPVTGRITPIVPRLFQVGKFIDTNLGIFSMQMERSFQNGEKK